MFVDGKGWNFPLQNLVILRLLRGKHLFKFSYKNFLKTLILTSIRRRFVEITDHYLEMEVKMWFRQAQLRYKREQEKLLGTPE
jgi:hypothetical protein